MPDPIRKHFGYNQLRPLRPACSQNRAGSYMPDPTSCIQFGFVSFLQSEPGSYCAKPVRIRSGWPGQALAERIWPGSKPVCKDHRARFCCGLLPVSNFQTGLHPTFRRGCILLQTARIVILYRTSLDNCLVDCIKFWPSGHGPEASLCARTIGPASGQRS